MNPSSSSSSSTSPNKPAKPSLQSKLKNLPPELIKDIAFRTIQSRARTKLYQYQSLIIAKYVDHTIRLIGIHPKNPFLHIFRIPYTLTFGFSKKVLPFLWYLCQLHTIIIEFPVPSLNIALHTKFADPNNTIHLHTFLQWFRPIPEWIKLFANHPQQPCSYLIFGKPFIENRFQPFSIIHVGSKFSLYNSPF